MTHNSITDLALVLYMRNAAYVHVCTQHYSQACDSKSKGVLCSLLSSAQGVSALWKENKTTQLHNAAQYDPQAQQTAHKLLKATVIGQPASARGSLGFQFTLKSTLSKPAFSASAISKYCSSSVKACTGLLRRWRTVP